MYFKLWMENSQGCVLGELYSVLLLSLKTKKIQAGGKQQVACKCTCSICKLEICIFCLLKKTGGGLQVIFMCSSSVKASSSCLSVSYKRQGQSLSRGSGFLQRKQSLQGFWRHWQNRNTTNKGAVPQWLNRARRANLVMATRVRQKCCLPDMSVVMRKSEGQARMSGQQGKARIINAQGLCCCSGKEKGKAP